MADRTIDIGPVHVGRREGPHAPMAGKWVCADNCPHPDHACPKCGLRCDATACACPPSCIAWGKGGRR